MSTISEEMAKFEKQFPEKHKDHDSVVIDIDSEMSDKWELEEEEDIS